MKLPAKDLQPKVKEILLKLIEEERKNLPYTLGVKELLEILPHSKSKIYDMLKSGYLPAKKLGGKWLIQRSLFLAWLSAEKYDENIFQKTSVKI